MADAPRDANQVPVRLGDFSGTTVPISVEHATQFLKLNLASGTINVPVSVPSQDIRDANQVPVLMGRTSGGTLVPVSIDHATGRVKMISV